ncbi:MAG: hypothetical protein ACP6IY_17080 [Promethearchaeia archaeon]
MPEGILILEWNDKTGLEIIAGYPEKAKKRVSLKTRIQAFTMHEYTGTPGCVGLSIDGVNFASYYIGQKYNRYIMLILNILEDPEDYEKKLERIARLIIDNWQDERYLKMLPDFLGIANEKDDEKIKID